MLNPAWQPVPDHARRLIDISRHFLSDAPAQDPPPVADTDAMQLSVLLATHGDAPGLPEPGYLLRALVRQLNLPGATAGQDWHLQVCDGTAGVPPGEFVLLLIDSTLEATRHAYLLIKQLQTGGPRQIGVLYRAGDDLAAARRCYRRLAVGTLRFLDQPLVNLGWLPNPGPHFAAALAHAAQIIHSQRRGAHLEVVQ
ncbi:MAG: hypothetical protein ACLGH6_13730 [Gammaproteobacteria bacterium]